MSNIIKRILMGFTKKIKLAWAIMNMSARGRSKLVKAYNATLKTSDDESLYVCRRVSFGVNGNFERYVPITTIQESTNDSATN